MWRTQISVSLLYFLHRFVAVHSEFLLYYEYEISIIFLAKVAHVAYDINLVSNNSRLARVNPFEDNWSWKAF